MYSRLKRELVIVINRKKKYKLIRLMVTLGLIFSQLAPPFGTLMALSGHSRSKSPVTEVKADSVSTPKTGSFKLKKLDEDGKTPLNNVKFQLTSDSNTTTYQTEQITSGAGDASFANIPPGTYLLKEVVPPSGYQVMADYYRITVSPDGYTQYTYVKVGTTTSSPTTSLPSTSGGGTGGTVFRTSKTSGVVTVTDYNFTTKNKAQGNTDYTKLWATSGEFFDMSFKLKVNEGTQAGDSFTIKLSDYLSPNGIREKFISAPPLMLDQQVVATGIYDEASNSYIYTFNDLINHKQNAEIKVNYTFSPEAKKVDREWYVNTYNITNTIDGQKQDSGNFTIDYGEGQYMAGSLNDGLRLRNNITYLNRTTGEVEYTIYLNNGAPSRDSKYTVSDPWVALHYVNIAEKSSVVSFNKDDITVYRVPLSQKTTMMPYSMSGETDGLTTIPVSYDGQGFSLPKRSFLDSETGKNTAGILIKIKAKINSSLRNADVSLNAIWKYTQVGGQSNAKASVFELGNTSSGVANNIEPTVTIRNYKTKKGSIVFTKQDVETKKALSGVAFKLEKKEENDWQVVEKYKDVQTGTDGKLILSDLDAGEYQLIETKPLDGYLAVSGPVASFTITDQGLETSIKPSDKIIPNTKPGKQKIKVIKKDEQSRVPLAGAKFQLESNKGVVLTGETDGKGEYTFTNLPFGDYILTEIAAPKGYILDKIPRSIEIRDTAGKEPEPTVVAAAAPRTVQSVTPSATEVSGKDVSSNIIVKKVDVATTNGEPSLHVNPNQGENLIARSEFEIKTGIDINKGDYFAVKLSGNIDPFGVSTGETTTFNIIGPYGTLAVGKYDRQSRSIIYTFTDYVEKYEVSSFSTILPYFIDRYAVTSDADINISTSVGSQTNTAQVRVLYTPYYGYTDSKSPVNVGSMLTKLDLKNKTFTNYVYINPKHESIRNGELYFVGDGAAIINEATHITLYKALNNADMPPSWGVIDDNLTEEVSLPIVKQNGQVYINFRNKLEYGYSYVMKVVGGFNPDSEAPIKTSTTLYQRYYNYYGYYTDRGYWIPQGPYSEHFTYNAGAVLKSGESSADGALRVTMTNRKNNVEFTKTNATGDPLEASFELRQVKPDKTAVAVKTASSTKDTGKFAFEGIESGSYEIWETQVPSGYLKPDKPVATFTVGKDGVVKELTPDNGKIINYPNTAKITFTKMLASEKGATRSATKEEQANFSLWRLKDENGETTYTPQQIYDEQYYEPVLMNDVTRTATSDDKGNVLFDNLSPGFYAIKEDKAPSGYVKQQGIIRVFQVDNTGKVTKYRALDDRATTDKLLEITDSEAEFQQQFNEIINKPFIFPMTGGQGIALFVIVGATLMGLTYLGHRQRQKLN